MKIAVSAMEPGLDAQIDERFGRCRYFVIVDSETMKFETMENSSAANSGGAGTSTSQVIAGKGIEAVLTGNCGPNAFSVLNAAGIKVITGVSGKVREAIEQYKNGELTETNRASVPDHFGSGGGRSRGQGRGRGMGMR